MELGEEALREVERAVRAPRAEVDDGRLGRHAVGRDGDGLAAHGAASPLGLVECDNHVRARVDAAARAKAGCVVGRPAVIALGDWGGEGEGSEREGRDREETGEHFQRVRKREGAEGVSGVGKDK